MIVDKIALKSKMYHVHGGDARVFGKDADKRRAFDEDQVKARFTEVWAETIAPGLDDGQVISADEARELLGDEARKKFIVEGYEYRQFSVDSAAFLARVSAKQRPAFCDQLWSIGSHLDPTRLCVHFETVAALNAFSAVATRLGTKPKDLLLALAMDFLNKFPNRNVP